MRMVLVGVFLTLFQYILCNSYYYHYYFYYIYFSIFISRYRLRLAHSSIEFPF